jgi:hypothetical protein
LTINTAVLLTPAAVPVIVGVAAVETATVETVNEPEVEPAGIVMLGGTVAEAPELEISTTMPPVGAAVVSVAVPVDGRPPTTVVGERLRADSATPAGVTERIADLVEPEYVAVIVADEDDVTESDVTVKFAEVEPAGIVTPGETVATAVFRLASTMLAPPVGAAALKVTVPVDVLPPATLAGLSETPSRAAAPGLTVKVAVLAPP